MLWTLPVLAQPVNGPTDASLGQGPEVYLSLKGREGPLTVALMPFETNNLLDEELRLLAEMLRGVLIEDLRNSARLEVLADSLLVDEFDYQKRADIFSRLTSAGARALLVGAVRGEEDDRSVFVRLFRLPDGRALLTHSYPVPAEHSRKAAHRISDDVVFALTEHRGVAATQLAFVSDRGGNKAVWVMDADGHQARALTQDARVYLSPDWAPEGGRIVFSKMQEEKWELGIVDLRSKTQSPLQTPSRMNTAPAWSPDGTQVLFAMHDQANIDLYTLALEDGSLLRLTRHPEVDTEPCWSPDGSRIAFTSDRGGMPQVYTMKADGTDIRRLTWEPDAYEGSPSWSPDGKRLAFVRRGGEGFDIYVTAFEDMQLVRLTDQGSNENPCWSPDGLQIAFSSNRDKGWDIYVVNWDGSNLRRLTQEGGNLQPAWSPFPQGSEYGP